MITHHEIEKEIERLKAMIRDTRSNKTEDYKKVVVKWGVQDYEFDVPALEMVNMKMIMDDVSAENPVALVQSMYSKNPDLCYIVLHYSIIQKMLLIVKHLDVCESVPKYAETARRISQFYINYVRPAIPYEFNNPNNAMHSFHARAIEINNSGNSFITSIVDILKSARSFPLTIIPDINHTISKTIMSKKNVKDTSAGIGVETVEKVKKVVKKKNRIRVHFIKL